MQCTENTNTLRLLASLALVVFLAVFASAVVSCDEIAGRLAARRMETTAAKDFERPRPALWETAK